MTFTGNRFLAEEQIEKTLADLGVSKLVTSVEAEAEMLMTRAEEMLWPATERRTPWRDVLTRAVANPRWVWLPAKGLETLKTLAIGQGRWRWTEDGYIETGPFPPAKTSVSVSERDYDEATGKATIEVTARNAGPHGRVHFAPQPGVSAASPTVPDTIFETSDTVLYFRAIDPDGQHDTGDEHRWQNKLTLTHQPRNLPGKRLVELTVKPRGTIRWNTTGANPKEGAVYQGPVELPADGEITIFACAEDNGVYATRSFLIPRPDRPDFALDKSRPAKLHRKLNYRGNNEAFTALNAAKALQMELGNVSVEIGEGARNVVTRFGSGTIIPAEHLDQFIATARKTIGDETAEVKISFSDLHFRSGHDLESFLAKLGLEIAAGEVEQ